MEGCGKRNDAHRYADGELRGADAAAFESHMIDCADCAALVADARALDNLFGAKARVAPRPEMKEQILREARKQAGVGAAALFRRMALAAACLCIALAGLLSVQLRGGATPDSMAALPVIAEAQLAAQSQFLPGVDLSENEMQLLTGDDDQALGVYYAAIFE